MNEIKEECEGGILIANKFSRNIVPSGRESCIVLLGYSFGKIDRNRAYSYEELFQKIYLHTLEGDTI